MSFFKLFRRLSHALAVVASLLLIGIVLLMVTDSIMRSFVTPIGGALEIIQVAFVCVCFLSFAYTQLENRDIRVDIFRPMMRGRYGEFADFCASIFSASILGLIAYQGISRALHAYTIGDFLPGTVLIPLAIPWGAIGIGSFVAALAALYSALQSLRRIFGSTTQI